MTVAAWCVLVAALLPIACAWLAKSRGLGVPRSQGGFDNHDPRRWLGTLEGWRARANAAQANGFEAVPLFVAAVVLAQQAGVPQPRVDGLALGFIACRLVYIACYVMDRPNARSLAWVAGMAASIALLTSPAWSH